MLSALLLDNAAFIDVAEEVKRDDFYHPSHATLYKAMVALQDEKRARRPAYALRAPERRAKKLDAIGGLVFLAEIADFEATAAQRRAPRAHRARQGGEAQPDPRRDEIVETVLRAEASAPSELLDVAESRIFEISRSQSRQLVPAACTTRWSRRSTTSRRIMSRGGVAHRHRRPATTTSTR